MKDRNHTAYLSISASGPLNGEIDSLSTESKDREYADLRYTTADIDFFESHWRKEWGRDAKYKYHERLRNPKLEDVYRALHVIGAWFAYSKSTNPKEWVGGNIVIVFAGHGRMSDGAWVLENGHVSVDDLHEILNNYLKNDQNSLRTSIILDSCYSGKFLVNFLHKVYSDETSNLSPDYFSSACLHDEKAWEEPDLGHGLFTYSFSLNNIGPYRGIDIAPESYDNEEYRVFLGTGHGCSLLTFGEQNPIRFDNGTFDVCGKYFSIHEEREPHKLLTVNEIFEKLEYHRFFIMEEITRIKRSGYYIKKSDLSNEGINYDDPSSGTFNVRRKI